MQTPLLELPYVAAGQAQKHVTVNEAFLALDSLTQLSAIDNLATAPPATSVEGARYIVPAGATGAWSGKVNMVAVWQSDGWIYFAPRTGWIAFVEARSACYVFKANSWQPLNAFDDIPKLGINTIADTTNRFALASAASLFDYVGTDHRLKSTRPAQRISQ
jgi:hypothetical protein